MHCEIIDCHFNIFFVEIHNWKNKPWKVLCFGDGGGGEWEIGCSNQYIGLQNELKTSLLSNYSSRGNHGQEAFLAPSGDKQTHNYNNECWVIYTVVKRPTLSGFSFKKGC